MLSGRGYYICTKCGRVENKKGIINTLIRFVLKMYYGY